MNRRPGRVLTWAYLLVVAALAVRMFAEPSVAVLSALVLLTLPCSLIAYAALVQFAYASPAQPPGWVALAVIVLVWLVAALGQLSLARHLHRRWVARRAPEPPAATPPQHEP